MVITAFRTPEEELIERRDTNREVRFFQQTLEGWWNLDTVTVGRDTRVLVRMPVHRSSWRRECQGWAGSSTLRTMRRGFQAVTHEFLRRFVWVGRRKSAVRSP